MGKPIRWVRPDSVLEPSHRILQISYLLHCPKCDLDADQMLVSDPLSRVRDAVPVGADPARASHPPVTVRPGSYPTRQEVDALLAAPSSKTRSGRRDHAPLLVTVQTGVRLSEVTGLGRENVNLGAGADRETGFGLL